MNKPTRFDANSETVGLGRDLAVTIVSARPDPPIEVDGVTIGIANYVGEFTSRRRDASGW